MSLKPRSRAGDLTYYVALIGHIEFSLLSQRTCPSKLGRPNASFGFLFRCGSFFGCSFDFSILLYSLNARFAADGERTLGFNEKLSFGL